MFENMAQYCAVPSCRMTKGKDNYESIILFSFPNDEELSKEWALRSGRFDLLEKSACQLHTSESLCDRHFEKHCFKNNERTILNAGVKPSLFDHEMSEFIHEIQEERKETKVYNTRSDVATVHYESLEDGANVIAFEIEISKKRPITGNIESVITTPLHSVNKVCVSSDVTYSEEHQQVVSTNIHHVTSTDLHQLIGPNIHQVTSTNIQLTSTNLQELVSTNIHHVDSTDLHHVESTDLHHLANASIHVANIDAGMELHQADNSGLHHYMDDHHVGTVEMDIMGPLGIVVEEVEVISEEPQVEKPNLTEMLYCRLCAEQSELLVSVFGQRGEEFGLPRKIRWHLPITVFVNDGLPQKVCSSCIAKLNCCHDMVENCLKADDKLRNIFKVEEPPVSQTKLANIFAGKLEFQDKTLKNEECENTKEHEIKEEVGETVIVKKKAKRGKRPPIHAHRLSRAMELLKKAKESTSKSFIRVKEPEDLFNESTKTENNIKPEPEDNNSQNEGVVKMEEPDSHYELASIETEPEEVGRVLRARLWVCNICGHKTQRKSALLLHQRMSHIDDKFCCNYCDKSFDNALGARLHERKHVTSRKHPTGLVCEFCGKSYSNRRMLRDHHTTHHAAIKPYACPHCTKSYSTLNSLDIHLATHSSETPYLCDLCGKSFKHVSNLRSHKRSHLDESDKNRQICNKCGKGFRTRFHLLEHTNVHLDRRPYSCNMCNKSFHKKIQLRQHGSAHSGAQPFQCPICGVRFNRRGNMTQHVKRHDREKVFVCRVCGSPFVSLGALLSHRKTHNREEVERSILSGDDPEHLAFKCEVCNKLLAKKESLVVHMRTHTGEKLFKCELCNKLLSNRGSLTYHVRSFHTNERPHICQFCGEGFLSREARQVHERIHTGEKPYKCEACGMAFRCSSNLTQHRLVHSDQRPYVCVHCEKRFQRKGALDVHTRTHTGERPYGCDICGRCFSQKNDMLKHRRTHGRSSSTLRTTATKQAHMCPHCNYVCKSNKELVMHQMEHLEQPLATQTVLITADNLITDLQDIPMVDSGQTVILHSF